MKYELWPQIMSDLKQHLSQETIERWFNNIIDVDKRQSTLYIKVHSDGQAEWMEKHYAQILQESAIKAADENLDVVFIMSEQQAFANDEPAEAQNAYQPENSGSNQGSRFNFNPRYNFESFVVGSSNRFAHAAALAVADRPAKNYNPLFLYGGSGLGKTHLMHAIGHRVLNLRPNTNILYISTETFTNEFISSVRQGSAHKFKNRYRTADIFLVDDIQFLTGKEETQVEFFHTFNALYEQGKQIVISSDRHPKDIATLEERLRSRFEGGLITDIQPPDLETRIAILQYKSSIENLKITNDAIAYIASNIPSNIRELEGALNRVKYYALVNNSPIINLSLTETVMDDILPNKQKQALSPNLIKDCVSSYFNLQSGDLASPRRDQSITKPRHIAMYLCQTLLHMSLNEIGEHFGKRDHTTVLNGTKKITNNLKTDVSLQKSIQELTDIINRS